MSGLVLFQRPSRTRANEHEEHHEEGNRCQGPADTNRAVHGLEATIRIPGGCPTILELAMGDDQGTQTHERYTTLHASQLGAKK